MIRAILRLLVLSALCAPSALAAQTVSIGGRVVDYTGEPLPGVEVVLHAVTEGAGGDVLGRTTADGQGAFTFNVTPAANAFMFSAIRRGDTLYVGPPLRLEEQPGDHVLVVSEETGIPLGDARPGATASGQAPGFGVPPPPRAAPARGVLPWLIGLLLAVGGWMAYRRYAARRDPDGDRRWLLFELAQLDERFAERDDLEPSIRAEYLRRRAELERRLSEDARVA